MAERNAETDAQMRAHWLLYIDNEIEDLAMELQEGGDWAPKAYARWMWLRELVLPTPSTDPTPVQYEVRQLRSVHREDTHP